MKKVLLIIGLFLAAQTIKPAHAEDLVPKRRQLAQAGSSIATQLRDLIERAKLLRQERTQAGNFLDSDFVGQAGLTQITAYDIGAFFDTVVPAFDVALQDVNGVSSGAGDGFNKNILLKLRK